MQKKLKVKQPGIDEEEDMMSRILFRGRDRSKPNALNIYVATSRYSRDIINSRKEVATSSSSSDIIIYRRRSRQHQAVATPVPMKRGRDKIKLSRHQLHQRHVATKQMHLRQRLRQQGSRQGLDVATVSTTWDS